MIYMKRLRHHPEQRKIEEFTDWKWQEMTEEIIETLDDNKEETTDEDDVYIVNPKFLKKKQRGKQSKLRELKWDKQE